MHFQTFKEEDRIPDSCIPVEVTVKTIFLDILVGEKIVILI